MVTNIKLFTHFTKISHFIVNQNLAKINLKLPIKNAVISISLLRCSQDMNPQPHTPNHQVVIKKKTNNENNKTIKRGSNPNKHCDTVHMFALLIIKY